MRGGVTAVVVLVVVAGVVVWLAVSRCGRSDGPRPGSTAAAPCPNCNVILLTLDSLRADRVGPTLTPNIHRVAREAVVAEEAVSTSGLAGPSLESLFRGRYAFYDFVSQMNREGQAPQQSALLRTLLRNGYHTVSLVSHAWAGEGYIAGFDERHDGLRPAEELIPEAVQRLERLLEARKRFFVWIHLIEPHRPYLPEERLFHEQYPQGKSEPDLYDEKEVLRGGTNSGNFCARLDAVARRMGHRGPTRAYRFEQHCVARLDARQVQQLHALYNAYVKQTDAHLEPLLDLYEKALARSTVLVISADHGEALGESEIIGHGDLGYVTLRVPLILRAPGLYPRRLKTRVSHLDVAPTLLALLGLAPPSGLRGRSIFLRRPGELHLAFLQRRYAVLQGRNFFFEGNFYDVRRDPYTLRPLPRGKRYIKGLRRLRATITGRLRANARPEEVDRRLNRTLQSQGHGQ